MNPVLNYFFARIERNCEESNASSHLGYEATKRRSLQESLGLKLLVNCVLLVL